MTNPPDKIVADLPDCPTCRRSVRRPGGQADCGVDFWTLMKMLQEWARNPDRTDCPGWAPKGGKHG